MTVDKSSFTKLRRKDRAVEDVERLEAMLRDAPYLMYSTAVDNQPFTHVNTFVYEKESHALYMHTAITGTVRDNILKNEKVSFAVANMGRLLPAKTAKEMSVEYNSVFGTGTAEIMTDLKTGRDKMQLLVDKYFPHLKSGEDYAHLTEAACKEITIIKISITSWSGKAKKAEADFAGAFRFGEQI